VLLYLPVLANSRLTCSAKVQLRTLSSGYLLAKPSSWPAISAMRVEDKHSLRLVPVAVSQLRSLGERPHRWDCIGGKRFDG